LGSQMFTASNMDIRNAETIWMPPPGPIKSNNFMSLL
jgi:hypothetical protein